MPKLNYQWLLLVLTLGGLLWSFSASKTSIEKDIQNMNTTLTHIQDDVAGLRADFRLVHPPSVAYLEEKPNGSR